MVCQGTGSDGFSVKKKKILKKRFGFFLTTQKCCACHLSSNKKTNKKTKKKARKYQSGYNRDWFQPPMTWYLQGVEYCLQSTTSPPNASDSVSHLFSATAISHGLDTRVLLQRNPYNRLTVIKETSLQSNKISNFQLTRDAFQLAVLFSSFLSFLLLIFSIAFFVYPDLFHLSLIPRAL